MEAGERPGWLRAFLVVVGIVIIILGISVLINPDLGVTLILILFLIALFLAGIYGIAGGFQQEWPGWLRALSLTIGLLLLVLAIVIIILPFVGIVIQVLVFAIGLLLLGIRAIAFEGTNKSLAGWARGLAIAVGLVAIIVGILMIATPGDLGTFILVAYFAIGLFATGIGAVAAGWQG